MEQFSALVHVYQATVTMSVQLLILHGSSDSTSALGSVFLAYTREQWIFGSACHSYLTRVRVFIDPSLASLPFRMTEGQDMKITSIMINWIMVDAMRCTLDSRIKINCYLGDHVFHIQAIINILSSFTHSCHSRPVFLTFKKIFIYFSLTHFSENLLL